MFKYEEKNHFNPFDNNILSKLLKNRGIENEEEFINPSSKNIEPLCNFSMMSFGEKLIKEAVKNNYKISILYDCDVDGYTSGSIMYQICIKLGLHTQYILHNKKQHGLDIDTMNIICQQNPKLLIIPDAGSSDIEQINELLKKSINILVLDHHELSDEIDKTTYSQYIVNKNSGASCVIINNQLEKNIKDKAMTGVGIVYKFAQYLELSNYNIRANDYLDLVAFGMIGDRFDATQLQSRFLVLQGINKINYKCNSNKLIKYIFNKKNVNNHCNMIIIAFNFVPLLNALIRFGNIEDKKYLVKAINNIDETVTIKSHGKNTYSITIQEYVFKLCEKYNNKQKMEVNKATTELKKQIVQYQLNNTPVIVCNANGLNEVMTGLVANKISSEFNKPCILLHNGKYEKDNNEYYVGSARGNNNSSIKNFKSFLKQLNLFDNLIGHQNAFGVEIHQDNVPQLFNYLNSLNNSINVFSIPIDSKININDIDYIFMNKILKYQDLWGNGVEEPKFVTCFELDNKNIKLCGNGNTIQFYKNGLKYNYFNVPQKTLDTILNSEEKIICEFLIKFNRNSFLGTVENQIIIENVNILSKNQ